jgi:NADH:ubiquinone reductase (H+-translocating)
MALMLNNPSAGGAPRRPQVLIIGGGFGGLEAARGFARAAVDVTLVDRSNHHLFQPLLYQVATGGLSAPSIAAPMRSLFRQQINVTTLLGEVQALDIAARCAVLTDGTRLRWDHLIVAAGATHSYFGHGDWAPHAPGLKTLDDAFELRRRILLAYEQAEQRADGSLLHFVVVGAGPTGVEMAGTMAEIARHTLRDEFRRIDPATARIILVEGGPRVLPNMPEALSAQAKAQLKALGVEAALERPRDAHRRTRPDAADRRR